MQNRKTLMLGLTTMGLAALAYFLFSKSQDSFETPLIDESEFGVAQTPAADSQQPTISRRELEKGASTEPSVITPRAASPTLRPQPTDDVRIDDEASIMATLRGLAFTNPDRSIDLARKADERFPKSEDAAERSWYIIRCLDRTGRHEEAWKEAEAMVERFPSTSWADDVRRHVLRYPNGPYLPKSAAAADKPEAVP